jgi:hypothetical protein
VQSNVTATMKSTIILYGALLATTTLANPVAKNQKCWLPSQGCAKAARSLERLSSVHMKRAAEAQISFCWLPGQHCEKEDTAKRDALPEAIASAAADAEAVSQFCSRFGQPCSKLKRVANAVAEAMAVPDTLPGPEDVNGTANHYCYGSRQPCALARRSALAIAQEFPLLPSQPDHEKHHHFCWLPGETCGVFKRDTMARRSALARPQEFPLLPSQSDHEKHHHFCWLPGETCGVFKRDALAAAEALADIEFEHTKRDVDYDVAAAQKYCDSEAGPCSELKRFAAAIVDAIADPDVAARALESEEDEVVKKRCYAAGGACEISKRMVEKLEKMTTVY